MKNLILFLCIFSLSFSVFAQESKVYYEDGTLQTDISDEGIKTFHPNGKLSTIIRQQNRMPHGKTEAFDNEGKLLSEIDYDEGMMLTARYYGENGKVIREENRENGTWKQFNDAGEVSLEGEFEDVI